MSYQNKINAIDMFALPVLTLVMQVIYFSREDLNEVDLKLKLLLSEIGERHALHPNTLLYAHRSIRGRRLTHVQRNQNQGCNEDGD